jgi:hypothetical protein
MTGPGYLVLAGHLVQLPVQRHAGHQQDSAVPQMVPAAAALQVAAAPADDLPLPPGEQLCWPRRILGKVGFHCCPLHPLAHNPGDTEA